MMGTCWPAMGLSAIADPVRGGGVDGISVRSVVDICGEGTAELVADEIVL